MSIKLIVVINLAYPDNKDLMDFYLELEFKEKRSSWSSYEFYHKRIKVNTFSRSPGDIFLSLLQEAAHHIDIKQRKETHPDREYAKVFRKLLQTALEYNLITLQDLIRSKQDKMKKLLQDNFGSFKNWQVKVEDPNSERWIHVTEAYLIKNILKANGYSYDPEQNCWSKRVGVQDFLEEEAFIEQYKDMAEFTIISDHRFYVDPAYRVRVYTYSIEDKELFKALYYRYDVDKRCWWKVIPARSLNVELEQIEHLPKQKVVIGKNE